MMLRSSLLVRHRRILALSGLVAAASGGCVPEGQPAAAATQVAQAAVTPSEPYRVTVPLPPPALPVPKAPVALEKTVAALVEGFDGRVGVSVQSIDRGWHVASGGDLKLPQQSVSKLWVAMSVMDAIDAGRLSLDTPVTITSADLTLFHQPIAYLLKNGRYDTSVAELLRRALTQSDNTANDRLLKLVGGPQAVRSFIAQRGLGNIRFGPGERVLQATTAGLPWRQEYSQGNAFSLARARLPQATRIAAYKGYVADPPDGAGASAITDALARLHGGSLLSPDSTRWLLNTMAATRTGRARIRAALPPGWQVAHKTGTGQDLLGRTAGFNDVGILTAPDGRAYAVAVMIGDTARPVRERQQLIQTVVSAIVAVHG